MKFLVFHIARSGKLSGEDLNAEKFNENLQMDKCFTKCSLCLPKAPHLLSVYY